VIQSNRCSSKGGSALLEPFDAKKHEAPFVAGMIYDADPEFNQLIFGSRNLAIDRIIRAMKVPGSFFSAPQLSCIRSENRIVGIVSGYLLREKTRMEACTGMAFLQAFGLLGFLRKLPVLLKMNRIMGGKKNPNGFYIVYLCVSESERGKGFGAEALRELASLHPILSLHVSAANDAAFRFYEKIGFMTILKRHALIGGSPHGAWLMERK